MLGMLGERKRTPRQKNGGVGANKRRVEMHKPLVEAHKRFVEMHKRLVETHKRLVEVHKRLVEANKRLVEMHKRFVETHKRLVEMHKPLVEVRKRSPDRVNRRLGAGNEGGRELLAPSNASDAPLSIRNGGVAIAGAKSSLPPLSGVSATALFPCFIGLS